MSVYDDKPEDEIRNILQIYCQNYEKRTGKKLNVLEVAKLIKNEADKRDQEHFVRAFAHFTAGSLRMAAQILEEGR